MFNKMQLWQVAFSVLLFMIIYFILPSRNTNVTKKSVGYFSSTYIFMFLFVFVWAVASDRYVSPSQMQKWLSFGLLAQKIVIRIIINLPTVATSILSLKIQNPMTGSHLQQGLCHKSFVRIPS